MRGRKAASRSQLASGSPKFVEESRMNGRDREQKRMGRAAVLEDREPRSLALHTNRIRATAARVAGARASVIAGAKKTATEDYVPGLEVDRPHPSFRITRSRRRSFRRGGVYTPEIVFR